MKKKKRTKRIWKKIVCTGILLAMLFGCFPQTVPAAGTDSSSAVINGTYQFASHAHSNVQLQDSFEFREDCFLRPSSSGCDHLLALSAQAALASVSAYSANDDYESDPSGNPANIIQMLQDMGFENVETNAYYRLEKLEDSAGVAVADRNIHAGAKNYTLLAIVPRSGGYKQEWAGSFHVGDGDIHAGYKAGRDEILRFLKQYISRHQIQGDLKVWICGHGRGAAIGNLLGGFFAGGGIGYFGNSVQITPEDVYCYGYAMPRTVKNGVSKRAFFSVEGARGGEYASDTPGEAYAYTGSGTINVHDPVYNGIRCYPFEWDHITQFPLKAWGFDYFGNVCSMDDNGKISVLEMEKELAFIDADILLQYLTGGDSQNFQPMTLDLKDLSLKTTGEKGKASFADYLSRRISGLVTTSENNKQYVENGTEEMFRALAGVLGMLGKFRDEMKEGLDYPAAKAAVFSYLAFASEKLQAEGRAANETEAATIVLEDLLSLAGSRKLDLSATVDDLVKEGARLVADHKSSVFVQTFLSMADQMVPDEYKSLVRLFLQAFYPLKKGEDIKNVSLSELLYAAIYACAYGPLSGSTAATLRYTDQKCRNLVYQLLVTTLNKRVPNIKELIGTDGKGNVDGSNTLINLTGELWPVLLKGDSGETYGSIAEAADAGILKSLDSFFSRCEKTIAEKGLYTEAYLKTAKEHMENLKNHVSVLRKTLMNVLFSDGNTPYNTAENIESVITLAGNFGRFPVAHYQEVFVAWGKASLRRGTSLVGSSAVSLQPKTAVYTGNNIDIDKAVVKGSSGTVTYTYYSDSGCTKKVSEHKNRGTFYVKAKVAADAHNKAAESNVVKLVIKAKAITPEVTLSANSFKYDGTVKKPSVTVKDGNRKLAEDTDYTVNYSSGRKDVGTWQVTVKLKGNYSGSRTVSFKITKGTNSIKKLTPASRTFKASALKKQAKTFQLKATDKFGAKKTFALDKSKTKAKARKYIKVSKKGKVTVKKGTPKGNYSIKVKVTAAGTRNYKGKTATKTVKVVVK